MIERILETLLLWVGVSIVAGILISAWQMWRTRKRRG